MVDDGNRPVIKVQRPLKSALLIERQYRSGEDRFSELKPIKTQFNGPGNDIKNPSTAIRFEENAATSQIRAQIGN